MKYTIDQIIPNTDRLIVQLGPVKKLKHTLDVSDEAKNKGKKPEEIHDTKRVTETIEANYQVAKILAIDPTMEERHNYTVGEWIIFNQHAAIPLDLFSNKVNDKKCPLMIKYYDIVGKISNESLK